MTSIKYFLFFAITAIAFSGCTLPGSPSDTDRDGIADFRDVCKVTPAGATVDRHGCAIDEDFDGVIDLYDKCPNTSASQLVDQTGCTIREL